MAKVLIKRVGSKIFTETKLTGLTHMTWEKVKKYSIKSFYVGVVQACCTLLSISNGDHANLFLV